MHKFIKFLKPTKNEFRRLGSVLIARYRVLPWCLAGLLNGNSQIILMFKRYFYLSNQGGRSFRRRTN